MEIKVDLGWVGGEFGRLHFELIKRDSGEFEIVIWANDPSDGRRSGTLVRLDDRKRKKLYEILGEARKTEEKLRKTSI